MKILFITGSIEAGKDGISDYTLQLIAELSKKGVSCAVLAINDRFTEDSIPERKNINHLLVNVLKLPSIDKLSSKHGVCEKFLKDFEPDWVSFQFVGYAHHRLALPVGLGKFIRNIAGNTPIEIMFHELWAGIEISTSIKMRLLGKIQRQFVLSMLHQLKPEIIHTNTELYISVLKSYGLKPIKLPLFGNIPVIEKPDFSWIFRKISEELKIDFVPEKRNKYIVFGIFGTIYQDWQPEILFAKLREKTEKSGQKMILLSIGKVVYPEKFNQLKLNFPEIDFALFGENPAGKISEFLQFIDFGIVNTPLGFLEKSGSFVAMQEHGLPVFCQNDKQQFSKKHKFSLVNINNLYVVSENSVLPDLTNLSKTEKFSHLPDIARKFLQDLPY